MRPLGEEGGVVFW